MLVRAVDVESFINGGLASQFCLFCVLFSWQQTIENVKTLYSYENVFGNIEASLLVTQRSNSLRNFYRSCGILEYSDFHDEIVFYVSLLVLALG